MFLEGPQKIWGGRAPPNPGTVMFLQFLCPVIWRSLINMNPI